MKKVNENEIGIDDLHRLDDMTKVAMVRFWKQRYWNGFTAGALVVSIPLFILILDRLFGFNL